MVWMTPPSKVMSYTMATLLSVRGKSFTSEVVFRQQRTHRRHDERSIALSAVHVDDRAVLDRVDHLRRAAEVDE